MPQFPRVASSSASPSLRLPASSGAVERCWLRAAVPADWALPREAFVQKLEKSMAHEIARRPIPATHNSAPEPVAADENTIEDMNIAEQKIGAQKIAAYLDSLNAPDLALACACSAGSPSAWDYFIKNFRPELYRAARAIAGEAHARELADSLYADLYGLRERDGERKSLFEYFHGRSKLGTWLRAILSQRYVDEIRRSRHTESLDDESQNRPPLAAPAQDLQTTAPDAEREKYLVMLQAILTAVLAALDPRDRLRMAYYYANDLTLAQIGKLMGEHEATVSRKLERTRRDIRQSVERKLRSEKKLQVAQMRQCFEYAREQWPFDLMEVLTKDG